MSEDGQRTNTLLPGGTTAYNKANQIPALSVRLEEDNRHPVMIFGGSRSGKSTMIMSLINAAEKAGRDGTVGISSTFGQSFYERRDDRAETQMRYARDLFDTASYNFIQEGQALKGTQVDTPFFVPIDLQVQGREMDVVKLALLDGRGEWYLPIKKDNTPIYQNLQDDIVEVFKNYSRGISVIFVAPYSMGETDQYDTTESDAGIFNVLGQYSEYRLEQSRYEDSMLLLLSKWDQVASPQRDDRFLRVNGSEIVSILERRYGRTWDRFRTLPIGTNDWERRSFMQYTSCSFVDGKPRIPSHLTEEYLRYPRTVLNWIYSNARRFEFKLGAKTAVGNLTLFSDVVSPDRALIPISERILRAIVRR